MILVERNVIKKYDVVVVGGGMSGICAAIAAARNGAQVALIQNRSMLGGNASSEIRMHICGANCQLVKKNVNETGILLEMMLENKRLNPRYNYNIWDTVLIDAVYRTEGLDLFLNTQMYEVDCSDNVIKFISCVQSSTERKIKFEANIFIDCTGNGTLGFYAGAEYRMGSEGREEFGEPDAQESANDNLMGNTLLFKAVDCGHPVSFTKPDWAYSFTEKQLEKRVHYNYTGMLNGNKLSADGNGLPELYCSDYGYWWIELGGDSGDIIGKSEEIRDELMKSLWGIWDHIKNGGEHGAANYDLQWCGIVPGTRDSRRLVGDYLLNENDILSNRIFDDAVAYGGWPMDVHSPGGLRDFDKSPSNVIHFDGIYTIPYRSYYSINIKNLMMAGRIISATKLGMSSARVMGTCSVGGQAAGTAAAFCIRYGCLPREIGQKHINELQQQLIKDDCFIPGIQPQIQKNQISRLSVSASSEIDGYEASNVLDLFSRPDDAGSHCWRSEKLGKDGAELCIHTERLTSLTAVELCFDPDLSGEMAISLSSKKQAQQYTTLPPILVADYEITLLNKGRETMFLPVQKNHKRTVRHLFDSVIVDEVRIKVLSTYGADFASVYRVALFK